MLDEIDQKIYNERQAAFMTMQWTKISHDVNGNPRYVCHYMNLLTDEEKINLAWNERYPMACKRANTIGGRKYHNRQYGGGIVFQSYSIQETEQAIHEAIKKAY